MVDQDERLSESPDSTEETPEEPVSPEELAEHERESTMSEQREQRHELAEEIERAQLEDSDIEQIAQESGRSEQEIESAVDQLEMEEEVGTWQSIARLFRDILTYIQGLFGGLGLSGRSESNENRGTPTEQLDFDLNPEVTREEIASLQPLSSSEIEYVNTLMAHRINPLNVIQLMTHDRLDHLNRAAIFKYVSEMAEATDAYPGGIHQYEMVPVLLAYAIIESRFRDEVVNQHGYTGLYQHGPDGWSDKIEDYASVLEANNVVDTSNPQAVEQSIFDSRAQSFVTVNTIMEDFNRISNGMRIQEYGIDKFSRDTYLMHNMGGAHRWLIGYLDGRISENELGNLYKNRVERNGDWYTEDGRRFENYAWRRVNKEDPTYERVARWTSEIRSILFPRRALG